MDAIKDGMLATAKAAEAAARLGESLFGGKQKFNSQICTSREQSERLLALGLKKETADMVHFFSQSLAQDWTIVPLAVNETARNIEGVEIPAWSLHRLIELKQPNTIDNAVVVLSREQTYDKLIGMIAKSIKEGYFNKEYLEE